MSKQNIKRKSRQVKPKDSKPLPPQAHTTVAWAVHAFTMTGVIWAGLATLDLINGNLVRMWMWLVIALVVDGIDGTMARKAEVTKWVPNFDGAVLDNIVDYLTWTFIPAVFIYLHIPLGAPWIGVCMFGLIVLSSMFCYCNTALKTHDYYFMGFPAAWNVVAVILWVIGSNSAFNIAIIIILAVLTLAPITFVHPFRVGTLMPYNILATAIWVVATVWLVLVHPERPVAVEIFWWASGLWLMVISAWRSTQEFVRIRKGR